MVDEKRNIKCEAEFIVGVAAPPVLLPFHRCTSGPGSQSTGLGNAQELIVSTTLCLSLEISAQLFFLIKTAFINPPKPWAKKKLR